MEGDGIRCSRCGSGKLEIEKYQKRCLVCEKTTSRNHFLKALSYIWAIVSGG